MNKSISEISSGIDKLSELNEDALDELSDKYSEMINVQQNISDEIYESGNRIVQSNERLTDEISETGRNLSEKITTSGLNISNAVNNSTLINAHGYHKIEKSIQNAGWSSMVGSIVAGSMINSALVGIGAVLKYRERMEQLRHKDTLSFKEENSDAGKARRELKTAAAVLFAGDSQQAETHLKNSLLLFPSSAETFRLRSIIESTSEKHSEAIVSLKTALKLSEDKNLFPAINNIDGSINDDFHEKVVTSSLTQLSQEFTIINQIEQALIYLSDGIDRYEENPDLQFQRIKVLCKSKSWENHFESYISRLIKISPKHYNILYTDLQLGNRKKDVQLHLRSIKKENQKQLQFKKQALLMLSEGQSTELEIFNVQPKIESLNYIDLVTAMESLTKEIKKQTRK